MNEETKWLRAITVRRIELIDDVLAAFPESTDEETLAALRRDGIHAKQNLAAIDAGTLMAWKAGEGPI